MSIGKGTIPDDKLVDELCAADVKAKELRQKIKKLTTDHSANRLQLEREKKHYTRRHRQLTAEFSIRLGNCPKNDRIRAEYLGELLFAAYNPLLTGFAKARYPQDCIRDSNFPDWLSNFALAKVLYRIRERKYKPLGSLLGFCCFIVKRDAIGEWRIQSSFEDLAPYRFEIAIETADGNRVPNDPTDPKQFPAAEIAAARERIRDAFRAVEAHSAKSGEFARRHYLYCETLPKISEDTNISIQRLYKRKQSADAALQRELGHLKEAARRTRS